MKIDLNFGQVIDEMSLSSEQAEGMASFVLGKVTELIFNSWRGVAGRELKSTRSSYIRGLQVIEEGKLSNSIVLFGDLNNMLESGAPPFDMKEGLLAGAKKRDKKGNPFTSVPFRMGVPSSLGENQAFSGILPQEVYSALAKVRKQGGDTLFGSQVPSPYDNKRVRPKIPQTASTPEFKAYRHKVSIYAGLKNTGATGHSQYVTFRRVSKNSDPDSWIHKGFEAHNLAEKAVKEANIPNGVELFIDQYLNSL